MLIVGRIKNRTLQALVVSCKGCGKMWELTDFSSLGICPDCMKKISDNVSKLQAEGMK